ncbi:MAG: hypothetical protein RJB11_3351 [Planctomycetota bacterium]
MVTPRRVARRNSQTVDADAVNVRRESLTDVMVDTRSNWSHYTITSILVIISSLGVIFYLFATVGLRSIGPSKRRTDDPVRRVWIDPQPNTESFGVSFAVAESRGRQEERMVQLARAELQEPGQSDPNKPPPIAPSKKPTSNPQPSKPSDSAGSPSPPQTPSPGTATPDPVAANAKPADRTDTAAASPKADAAKVEGDKAAASKPSSPNATPQPPAPASKNGNSTIKELGEFVQKKLTPVFQGGVFASYSLDVLSTETTGATSVKFTDGLSNTSRERVVDSFFGVGQRVSLGIRGNLVGYRASYSNFTEETSRFDRPDFRSIWPDMSSMTRIDMHIADIELTQSHSINDICLESFFGVRYAEYRAADMAIGVGKFATNLEAHAIAHSFREAEGIGPTFGLSAKRHLPWKFGCGMFESCEKSDCGNLGWSWFWSARGSVLRSRVLSSAYTESQLGIYSSDTGVQGVARSADKSYLDQSTELNLFNGEFQLGLEYCRPLAFIPATASLRTSLVCQYWDTGPGISTSQSYATLSGSSPNFSGRVDSLAISDNRYLNLFGVNLTMGLNY